MPWFKWSRNKEVNKAYENTFTDADQNKKSLAELRETIHESRSGKYKYYFFQQDLPWKKRQIAKEKIVSIAAASETEKEQRAMIAQQGSRDSLFHN